MKRSVAIVVHIYKSALTGYERISLTQVHHVLGHYPVYLIAPRGLDVTDYREILKDQLSDIVFFDKKYFIDLRGYNSLLLNQKYYKPFLKFSHILLHHTDAFVFRDELEFWVNKDLDQIGPPVYEYDGTPHPSRYFFAGNGGLSLRKVKTFYRLAGSFTSVFNRDELLADFMNYNWKGKISRLGYYFLMITTLGSRLHPAFNRIRINEDAIWGMLVPKYISGFKNASFEDGYKFGTEYNCDKLMELSDRELPFGCHGWYKPMFIDFWRPYIEAQGYQVE